MIQEKPKNLFTEWIQLRQFAIHRHACAILSLHTVNFKCTHYHTVSLHATPKAPYSAQFFAASDQIFASPVVSGKLGTPREAILSSWAHDADDRGKWIPRVCHDDNMSLSSRGCMSADPCADYIGIRHNRPPSTSDQMDRPSPCDSDGKHVHTIGVLLIVGSIACTQMRPTAIDVARSVVCVSVCVCWV